MSNIIYLQMDDEEVFAWVTELSHRHHSVFKVSFKNEYENIFYKDVENGFWIEEDLGYTELAQNVGSQIWNFINHPIHVPKLLVWHKEYHDSKKFCFGFTSHTKDDLRLYEIYNCQKKYLYTLAETIEGEWQILGNQSSLLGNIDPAFVLQVIDILPYYSAGVD